MAEGSECLEEAKTFLRKNGRKRKGNKTGTQGKKLRRKKSGKTGKRRFKQQRAAFEEEMKGRELEEKEEKQLEKRDANAKLAKKAEKDCQVEMRVKKTVFKNRIFFVILLLLCFAAGFGAAVFVA